MGTRHWIWNFTEKKPLWYRSSWMEQDLRNHLGNTVLKSTLRVKKWLLQTKKSFFSEQMEDWKHHSYGWGANECRKNSYRTHWKIRSIALTVVQNQTGKWEKCTERKNTINPQSHELHLTLVNSSVSLLRSAVTLVEPNGKWSSGYLFLA